MADTATLRKRMRKQSLGSNVNTWGDKIDEILDVIDQCMDGYISVALTGNLDLTATTTNYTTSDTSKYRAVNFTGSPGNVTFPSVQGWYLLINNTSGTVVALCSGGTGVSIPTGYKVLVYCDAADIRNGAPQLFSGAITVAGQIHGVSAGTAGTDAVNVTQMGTAIAAAATVTSTIAGLVDINDTTAGYLGTKLTRIGAIKQRILGVLGNESIQHKLQEETTITTTGQTVAVGSITPVDTSGGAIAVLNLPALGSGDTALQDGDVVFLCDVGASIETNNVTSITGNAGNIVFKTEAPAATITWNGPNCSMLKFKWKASTSQWIGNGFD